MSAAGLAAVQEKVLRTLAETKARGSGLLLSAVSRSRGSLAEGGDEQEEDEFGEADPEGVRLLPAGWVGPRNPTAGLSGRPCISGCVPFTFPGLSASRGLRVSGFGFRV